MPAGKKRNASFSASSRSASRASSSDSSRSSSRMQSKSPSRSPGKSYGTQCFTRGSVRPKANAFDGCPLPKPEAALEKKPAGTPEPKSILQRCDILRKELLLKQRLRKLQEAQNKAEDFEKAKTKRAANNATDARMNSKSKAHSEREGSPSKELDNLITSFETNIKTTQECIPEKATHYSKKQRKDESVNAKASSNSSVSLTSEQRAALLQKTQSEWEKINSNACSSTAQDSTVTAGSETPQRVISSPAPKLSTQPAQSPVHSPWAARSPKLTSAAGESTWDVEKVKAVASPMRHHRRISLGTLQASPQPSPSPSPQVEKDPEKMPLLMGGAQSTDDPEKAARIARWEAILSPAPKICGELLTDIGSSQETAARQTPRAVRAYLNRSTSLPPKHSPGRGSCETPMQDRDRSRTPVGTPGTMRPPRPVTGRVPSCQASSPGRGRSQTPIVASSRSRTPSTVAHKAIEPDSSLSRQLDLDPLGYCPPASRPGCGMSSSKVLHKRILSGLGAFAASHASPAPSFDREGSIARCVTRSESIYRGASFDTDRERSLARSQSALPCRSQSLHRCPSLDARKGKGTSVAMDDGRASVARMDRHESVARSESAHRPVTVSQRVRMLTKFLHDSDWKVRQAAVQDLLKLEEDTLAAAGLQKIHRARSAFCEPQSAEVLEVYESDSDLEILEVKDAENQLLTSDMFHATD